LKRLLLVLDTYYSLRCYDFLYPPLLQLLYRSIQIVVVVVMIDAVVLFIVAAAAAAILLPPERFIRLFNGFNPSGGDAGNRIDGRTRFRLLFVLLAVLRPAADGPPLSSSLLLGNHGELLLLLGRLRMRDIITRFRGRGRGMRSTGLDGGGFF